MNARQFWREVRADRAKLVRLVVLVAFVTAFSVLAGAAMWAAMGYVRP